MLFEKIKNLKKGKHAVTVGCLALGVCLLSSSVYANYDDAKGYSNYKDAVLNLVLYEQNYSADGRVAILIDGEEKMAMDVNLLVDGNDMSSTNTTIIGGEEFSTDMEVVKGKTSYNYSSRTNEYYENDASDWRIDTSDKTVQKAIKFSELFADTMVGDLKNNFVLASKDGDLRTYEINVSGNQMPELINAGLSLMFSGLNTAENNIEMEGGTTYDNYEACLLKYYNDKEGTTYTLRDWYSDENNDIDLYDYSDEMEKYYQEIYDSQCKGNQVLYVMSDGTTKVYKNYKEMNLNEHPQNIDNLDIVRLMGEDPYLQNASCTYTVDKNGKIHNDTMEATMVGADKQGNKHTVTLRITGNVKDYGTTEVPDFDKSGKVKREYW